MLSKETFTLSFQPARIEYEITIGKNLINQALVFASTLASQIFVLTTNEVFQLLPEMKEEKILLPSGESIKTRAIKEKVEDFLIERSIGRDCCLVGIGGGALLDVVGFVAATYCRGIPYVSIPTTLIAMTDAAIGGKTGVNVESAKNWIGSFYHPKKIFIDLDFIVSLSDKEYVYGLCETIKHSLIADKAFYQFLEENLESIFKRDTQILQKMISKSCEIKKKIVEEDSFETKGFRYILNFGHTIGHALETHSNYTCPHGEAIFQGMLIETVLSQLKGHLSKEEMKRIHQFFKRLPISLKLPGSLSYESLRRDKKGAHRFVALRSIGSVVSFNNSYTDHLTENELHEAWKYVSSNN